MKRSDINAAIEEAKKRLEEYRITLPIFGYWSPDMWKTQRDKNDTENRAPYAEKYILLDDETEQEIPLHYHKDKTEDIINRGGGVFVVEMYGRGEDDGLDQKRTVSVYMDGIRHEFVPGEKIRVLSGNSITLEPYYFHRFYAEKGQGYLIVGMVSKVNDDHGSCGQCFFQVRRAVYPH